MSQIPTDNNNYQSGGYGGGKSGPMNQISNSLGDTIQNQMTSAGQRSTTDFGRNSLPIIGQIGGDFARGVIPDNNYQGGPPKLDLSGLFKDVGNTVANKMVGTKTPEQIVAESRAGGGILRLRQPPQTFNPNPTPTPGFGGGKGIIQPINGYGGGKSGPPTTLPDGRQPDNNIQMRFPVEGRYLD